MKIATRTSNVRTFYAKIYCGLREGYDGLQHAYHEVIPICQDFCNENSVGFTVIHTVFLYPTNKESEVLSNELGVIIQLLNYPRFPSKEHEIQELAIKLAKQLMVAFNQKRMSIEMPQITIMLDASDLDPLPQIQEG